MIAETRPERILVVKVSIGASVRQAAAAAGYDGDIVLHPFPVRQWRSVYVRELSAALSGSRPG